MADLLRDSRVRHNGHVAEIFISYRVRGQAGYAALLDRELRRRFGPGAVFRAPRSLVPGDDFAAEIFRNLHMCAVLLAVIGPGWLIAGEDDRSGSADAVDWVRREIAAAFAHRLRVIPVLVEGAHMPAQAELPGDIAALARCHGLRIRDSSADSDIARIISEIGLLVPQLRGTTGSPDEATDTRIRLFRMASVPDSAIRIGIVPGGIRRVRFAGIWVNSENTDMEMSRFSEFSVSAIIRYYGARRDQAGRVIDDVIARELAECLDARRCVAPGVAIVTGSGTLRDSHNVSYVIHVAAVQGEPGAGFRQVRDVGDCVVNALTAAERLADADPAARTILIPLLGAGIAGAPIGKTVRALLRAAIDHIAAKPSTPLEVIYFLAYTERELREFVEATRETPRLISAEEKSV